MANRNSPSPGGAQVTETALTTIGNVSKALAASTSMLLRFAATGSVAGALGVRAFLDSLPRVQPVPPVSRDAGGPAAAAGTPVDRRGEPEARDGSPASRVREPHVTEQVDHATTEVAAPEPAEEPAVEQGPEEQPAQVDTPPIENWDQLTLASARARMRRLSLQELRRLLAYERSHAERGSVVSMLENRVSKLEAGGA